MARTKRTQSAAGDLGEYRRKRNFQRTNEPVGDRDQGSGTGRLFVVQKHAA
jgi:hypothetical protein